MSKSIEELHELRGSTDCVLLGCGSSINQITTAQWLNILSRDTWALNNWAYHPVIVPKFYHVECKWYDYELMLNRLNSKREVYKNTYFVFPKGKKIILKNGDKKLLRDLAVDPSNAYEYSMLSRDTKRTHKKLNADYSITDNWLLTKSYDMSITAVVELLYKMGYTVIYTYGIDLRDSYYFWTGRDDCGIVHHQTNKEHEGKDPKKPHATHRIAEFFKDFNERWMQPNNREICVGHEDSLLANYLRVKSL